MNEHRPALSRRECVAFFIAMLGVQLASELFAQWGTYFYSPSQETGRTVYVSLGLVAFIFMAGRVFDIVTDPLIGAWSDHTDTAKSRFPFAPRGRRRPFIFWGSLLMTATGILFWYPPVAEQSTLNFVYGTALMSLHWGFYTLAYIPILALAPEIARTRDERVRLGTWIGAGMVLGLVIAAIVPGELITLLDPARSADAETPAFSAVGYQRVAIVFALISLLSFQWLVWNVRERPLAPREGEQTPSVRDLYFTLKLPVFRIYLALFFCFYLGMLANQRVLPYWAELALGGDEGTVSALGIPLALTALLTTLVMPLLLRRVSLRWMMAAGVGLMSLALPLSYPIAVAPISDDWKFVGGALVYAFTGAGLGVMYVLVTPVIGTIIDESERVLGRRGEAAFNAMSAVIIKAAQVCGIGLAVGVMAQFGNSSSNPLGAFLVGPVAGLFCVLAFFLAVKFFHPPEPRPGSDAQ